jgi:hypothetical protein
MQAQRLDQAPAAIRDVVRQDMWLVLDSFVIQASRVVLGCSTLLRANFRGEQTLTHDCNPQLNALWYVTLQYDRRVPYRSKVYGMTTINTMRIANRVLLSAMK